MPTGIVRTLVHLSQQTYQPTSRLVAGHNDKGYGMLRGEDGQEYYFAHHAVAGLRGFDNLTRGQIVEYTVDPESEFSADSVIANFNDAALPPAGHIADKYVTTFKHVPRTFCRPIQRPSIPHHPFDGYP